MKKQNLIEYTKSFETPFFLLNKSLVKKKVNEFYNIFKKSTTNYHLYYSVKTNYHPYLLKLFRELGVKLEVISGFEIDLISSLNLMDKDTIINGPSKSDYELNKIVKKDSIIQTDSLEEIISINKIARKYNKTIRIAIRMQPLNSSWKRFGVSKELASEYVDFISTKCSNLKLIGLHAHLGTQILEPIQYEDLTNFLVGFMEEKNLTKKLEYINIGGGFPSYKAPLTDHKKKPKSYTEYFQGIDKALEKVKKKTPFLKVIMEPGRALIDEAFDLVTTVMSSNDASIVLDTGKNHIPSLNIRFHPIIFEEKYSDKNLIPTKVNGCLCMRSDALPEPIDLPKLSRGDRLIIECVGAYSTSQSMIFIKYSPAIYIYDEKYQEKGFKQISRRQNIDDILSTCILN